MARTDGLLGERPGVEVRTRLGYDPRIIFFYFLGALLLAVLIGGLAYRQIFEVDIYHQRERQQNERRVLVPGPRGNIYDREGRALVENRPRFAVALYLDELQNEFLHEARVIRKAYLEAADRDLPTRGQFEQIARSTVVQRYLDQVNAILHRSEKVNLPALRKHFESELLIPYLLLDDLSAEEYAKLIERLPVQSPLQVYTASTRAYPYESAAAHTLGYVGTGADLDGESFPGEDLTTLKMKGSAGRDGLEYRFDSRLQGESGGSIFRVDPAGYKVNPPLVKRLPVQGKNLTVSLDIDLQLAAEASIGDQSGAAVALDVNTGEVLVLASKPDYNLADTSPRISPQTWQDILARGALVNQAVSGTYPPGSTFKILMSIAGLRSGRLSGDEAIVNCTGSLLIGKRAYPCENGRGHHGEIKLAEAIAHSCDIYFYEAGRLITPEVISAEAHRFHLDEKTGIELPHETNRMVIPTPDWKQRTQEERWFPGDTANMSIGQGYVLVSPLDMACFIASVARDETVTTPTLLHRADAPRQHSERIGLTPEQRATLLEGMTGCVEHGTAAPIFGLKAAKIPNVRVAGKTGTAQKRVLKEGKLGTINYAWFVCFAPVENPQIAIAVMIEGETLGENFEGGRNATPVAIAIMQKFFDKKAHPMPALKTNRGVE